MALRIPDVRLVAAMMAVLVASPAAATGPESHERMIHVSDLDLSSPAGMRSLKQRVAAALEAVCGSYAGTESSGAEEEADEIAQCRMAARAQVNQRVALLTGKDVSGKSVRVSSRH